MYILPENVLQDQPEALDLAGLKALAETITPEGRIKLFDTNRGQAINFRDPGRRLSETHPVNEEFYRLFEQHLRESEWKFTPLVTSGGFTVRRSQ